MEIDSVVRHKNMVILMAHANLFEGLEKSSYGNLASCQESLDAMEIGCILICQSLSPQLGYTHIDHENVTSLLVFCSCYLLTCRITNFLLLLSLLFYLISGNHASVLHFVSECFCSVVKVARTSRHLYGNDY